MGFHAPKSKQHTWVLFPLKVSQELSPGARWVSPELASPRPAWGQRPSSLISASAGDGCGSLLRDASQNVFDRVGKGCKPNDDKQVREGTTQESVVPVGLLEARDVGPDPRRVPIE